MIHCRNHTKQEIACTEAILQANFAWYDTFLYHGRPFCMAIFNIVDNENEELYLVSYGRSVKHTWSSGLGIVPLGSVSAVQPVYSRYLRKIKANSPHVLQ